MPLRAGRRAATTASPSCTAPTPSADCSTASTTVCRCCSSTKPASRPDGLSARRWPPSSTSRGWTTTRRWRPSTRTRRCARWPRPAPRSVRRSPSPRRRGSSGWPAGNAHDRCWSPPSAALPWSCDVLELLAEPGSPVPVSVRRNVPLPGWVGPLDLVIAVSLSGRAPGPLALAAEAARRGASLLTVGAADSPLAAVAAQARGVHIGIGRGRTTSRTALWSLLAPVLLGAGHLGIVDVDARVLTQTADRLDEVAETCRPSSESFVNPAKVLAADLAEGVPVVLGDGPLNGVAAARATSMLARTARVPATSGELPDDAAQVVACFDGPFTAAYSGGAPSLRGRGPGAGRRHLHRPLPRRTGGAAAVPADAARRAARPARPARPTRRASWPRP